MSKPDLYSQGRIIQEDAMIKFTNIYPSAANEDGLYAYAEIKDIWNKKDIASGFVYLRADAFLYAEIEETYIVLDNEGCYISTTKTVRLIEKETHY